jgi:hypothetical protein
MRFKEVISRITGINCPVFGASSNPPQPEIDAAKRVVRGLEDRRVLYNPFQLEDPHHCIQSVIEVRRLLTDALGNAQVSGPLADNLRAMRAACRKFLNRAQPEDGQRDGAPWHGAWGQSDFFDALGELRGVFGVHVAQIAVRYGLDVEDELASILPEVDDDDERRQAGRPTKRKGRTR